MALIAITTTTDLTGPYKAKRLASINLKNTGTACTVNIRNASASGTVLIPLFLDVGSTTPQQIRQAYPFPALPTFPDGIYVEVSGGTLVGSIDVV